MSSGSQNIGKWSNPIAGVGARPSQPAYTVPDDWDAEPTEDKGKDVRQIWEEANSRAPMPQIIVTGGSSPAPPPTSFTPAMRILQRPQSASPKAAAAATPQKSLAEREADYKAARQRIFAANSEVQATSTSTSVPSTKTNNTSGTDKAPSLKKPNRAEKQSEAVVRQPRGPGSNSGRGFRNRRTQGSSRGGTPSGSGAQSPSSHVTSRTQTPAPSGHGEKCP
ncbi:hypothetical protein DACRYDRAFT_22679 [Dacryopinax primogenitus]|uniref:SUZ RNA-binding domain-containing n=1 Tax=Dacryopinax primogenitus (strain DJM 731) TaxID=1858805 RepID=M5FYL9_DACPD|nr:uncharacterized protein DACRYDRAFT_22679 [Dacryopinax primogenitus]EJU01614.1 hypothetical protein DACRYDRAFT_22679 [Dacryopinax primogenitus]